MTEPPTTDDDHGTNVPARTTGDESGKDQAGGDISRRAVLGGLAATGALGAVGSARTVSEAVIEPPVHPQSEWMLKEPQLYTPWTRDVGPDNAHPEYPRPQMVREQWKNLNGVWGFAAASEGESPPVGEELDERVLVPYPIESGLSGIKRHEPRMWYRRQFEVPNEWLVASAHPGDGIENNPNSQRLLVHFERVDWDATVYVNGEEVARHKGGYDHFVADVTDVLVEGGPQELVVGVYDPTGLRTEPIGHQPIGRQGVGTGFKGQEGLGMTPTSGIWDTVWLEPVPDPHITNLDLTPDLDAEVLRLTVEATAENATVVATAADADGSVAGGNGKAKQGDDDGDTDGEVGRVTGSVGAELELPVSDPHLWSPEDPFLYDLDVVLRRTDGDGQADGADGGNPLDTVESYFGMRSVGKRMVDGTARPTLNGEMVWHLGTLESGQWPDGLYTAPTDEALRYNLEAQKRLGYNMVRKHSKAETRRWFYHADQLGLLVWQDIPNMPIAQSDNDDTTISQSTKDQFETELRELVTEHDNHPSMAVWIAFNEGWGISNDNTAYVNEIIEMISELDPERLVDPMSGFNVGSNTDPETGDVKDLHHYGTPYVIAPEPDPDRVSALGEYTSPSLVIEDHNWGQCGSNASAETFVTEYLESIEGLADLMASERLSASVYTATTGLENVCNGQITYDREVIKATRVENGLQRVREAHEALIERSRDVMGNVSLDTDVPLTYDSGATTGSPTPFEAAATLANPETTAEEDDPVEEVTIGLTGVPDGWTIEAETTTEFGAVGDGESASATWTVVPDASPDGDVTLEIALEYTIGDNQYGSTLEHTIGAVRLAYWRFEDSPADSSSYDNALTLNNGAGYDDEVAIEGDYSLVLDGEDGYALISDFGSGILHDAFTERTVSMWVNPDTTSGDQVLYNEGGFFTGFGVRISDGSLEVIAKSTGTAVSVSAPFDRTAWTHVATVFDRGALRLYVDGEEVAANENVGYDTVSGHVAGSELGGNATTTPWQYDEQASPFFDGHIDATSIYNRALSADRIAGLAEQF